MRIILIILMVVLIHRGNLRAQSISLFDIDASAHPTMRAKFYAYDAQGAQQRPTAGELSITEDGVARTVTNVTCPPPMPTRAVSSVLVVDISGSMDFTDKDVANIAIAKAAARAWINSMPLGSSECAVTSFDAGNYVNQEFTTERAKLLDAVNRLSARGGTSFDRALIEPYGSGLYVSMYGKHKKVIVMLTDGMSSTERVQEIVAEAHRQQCAIYCVTLGMPTPDVLRTIAVQTGGQVFDNVTTVNQAEHVYRQILPNVLGSLPCTVEWQSGTLCNPGSTKVELRFQGQTAVAHYMSPASAVAALEFSPGAFKFVRPPIGVTVEQTIMVTARNAAFNVTNISSTNPSFTLSPSSFTLRPDESRQLTLAYTAKDSGYAFARLILENERCPTISFYADGGYPGMRPTVPTLKLTHPNGGETFVVGSDTMITWEGIPATDSVHLDYSIDSGVSWKRLDKVSGQSYPWSNIPPPVSGRCLVRVRQIGDTAFATSSSQQDVRTLNGHSGSVYSVAFDPMGTIVASAGFDRTIKLWDRATGKEVRTLEGHTTIVRALAFSPDGSMLASASYDGTVRIWNYVSGDLIRTLLLKSRNNVYYNSQVYCVALSPDGSMVAGAGEDNYVRVWNVATGATLIDIVVDDDVNSVAFSPDGSMLALASDDGAIFLWDLAMASIRMALRGHTGGVTSVAFSPDGTMLASASSDRTIRYWDLKSGSEPDTLRGHVDGVRHIAFNPDGSLLASASYDNTIKCWDPSIGKEIRTIRGHTDWVHSVAFSPDGRTLASGSQDKTVKLWSVGDMSIQSDQSDSVFSIIKPVAASSDVDLGQCELGAEKDSVFADLVRNVGTAPFDVRSIAFGGADAAAFSLVAGMPEYRLLSGSGRFAEIRFRPSRIGLHQAQMIIITQSDTLVQQVRGTGVEPTLRVVSPLVYVGRIPVGTVKDTMGVLAVRNLGLVPIPISGTRHTGPNDADFTTIAGGGSFVLQPGETHRMDVRFTANRVGRTSGSIAFDYGGTGSPAVVGLFADVYDPNADTVRTTIAVDDVVAQAGEAVTIRLTIDEAEGRSPASLPRTFTAVLAVNATVVTCTDASIETVSYDSTKRFFILDGTRTSDSVLATLPVIATLGSTDVAPIELYAFQWTDPLDSTDVRLVTLRDGSIRIAGVCDSGGVRLYVPSDAGFSLASRPNPAGATVDLHFGLAGAGPVTIDVVDQTGRVLLSAVSETRLEAGVYTRSVDLSPLSNGPYMLMLRSGNNVLYSRMDVVR